jgi:hypothetical protein
LIGITEEEISSFLIATMAKVEKEDADPNAKLLFTRTLLFTCPLNYTVRSENSVPDTPAAALPSSPLSVKNEIRGE